MNKKNLKNLSVLAVFLLTSCAYLDQLGAGNTYMEDETVVSVSEKQITPAATAPAAPTVPCVEEEQPDPVIVPPVANDTDFVNFRETSADYREFGERTPRDQRIVTAGAGSNMAASIPPTIEEEVTDYEEEVNAAFDEAGNNDEEGSSTEGYGDDAVEDWLAEEGNTLKDLLRDWSERAGWRLIWNTNRNYTLAAGAMFRGRFADVSSALIRTFARARPAPIATFYKGNRVLVVETMEDENAYN